MEFTNNINVYDIKSSFNNANFFYSDNELLKYINEKLKSNYSNLKLNKLYNNIYLVSVNNNDNDYCVGLAKKEIS